VSYSAEITFSRITPSIGLEAEPGANPLGNYLNSLQLLLRLPDVPILAWRTARSG